MGIRIHDLEPADGSNKRGKRKARGIGGKGGKTDSVAVSASSANAALSGYGAGDFSEVAAASRALAVELTAPG